MDARSKALVERILQALPSNDAEELSRLGVSLLASPERAAIMSDLLVRVATAEVDRRRALHAGLLLYEQRLLAGVRVSSSSPGEWAPQVDGLLALAGFPLVKVEALREAAEATDRSWLAAVRARRDRESDPWVLATMASYLGRCGSGEDGAFLSSLLGQVDSRVVANALEALDRLGHPPPLSVVGRLLGSQDRRIRMAALAIYARTDPDAVLSDVERMALARSRETRCSVAHLLGQLGDRPHAIELLLDMLDLENSPSVIAQIARSLKENVRPGRELEIVGPVEDLSRRLSERLAAIQQLLRELAAELGLVETDIRALGQRYTKARRVAGRSTRRTRRSATIQLTMPKPGTS